MSENKKSHWKSVAFCRPIGTIFEPFSKWFKIVSYRKNLIIKEIYKHQLIRQNNNDVGSNFYCFKYNTNHLANFLNPNSSKPTLPKQEFGSVGIYNEI